MKKKPLIDRVIIGVNISIGILIGMTYTFRINPCQNEPRLNSWGMLIMLWILTEVLIGSVLALLCQYATSIVASVRKDPLHRKQHLIPPGMEAGFDSAYWVIGIASAYTMILYFFGLTDSFFSLALFMGA